MASLAVARRLAAVAVAPAATAAAARRAMSVLAVSSYDTPDDDLVEFPRKARGLDYDLNWSLAGDKITTRGEAYRNASVRDLLEFLPRKGTTVGKERGVSLASPGATPATLAFATDALPGTAAMDVEEAEARVDSVRDECLSFAPRLFVEDGAVGSCRATELRVRLVTDSPAVALFARAGLLHRIPLYDAEVFPRTVTLYVATLAGPEIDCGRTADGKPAPPHTIVDVDPVASRATVAAVGAASLASIRSALALAAGQLMSGSGGYRSAPGGDAQSPNIAEARADGSLGWYLHDGHWYAPRGEPHADLLALAGDVVVAAGAGAGAAPTTALVVGAPAGGVAAAAAGAGRLFAAHHAVWAGVGARSSVSALWAGASLPASSPAGAAGGRARGALTAQGAVSAPRPALLGGAPPRALPAPARVVIVDASAPEGAVPADAAVARVRAVAPLSDRQAAQLAARLAAPGGAAVTSVKSEADALKALGLA